MDYISHYKWCLNYCAFLAHSSVNISKGNLHTQHLFPYHIQKTVMYKNLPLLRMNSVYNNAEVKYPELDFICHLFTI